MPSATFLVRYRAPLAAAMHPKKRRMDSPESRTAALISKSPNSRLPWKICIKPTMTPAKAPAMQAISTAHRTRLHGTFR